MNIDGTRHNLAEEGMELQSGISHEINLQKVGGTLKVMIDRVEAQDYIGRIEADSPLRRICNKPQTYSGGHHD